MTNETNRFESIFWRESNRNYFWRTGMHYIVLETVGYQHFSFFLLVQ